MDSDSLRFLEVNEAALNHFGYSREEFLSMTLLDIHPPEGIPRLLESARHTFAEAEHRTKDGTLLTVEALVFCLSWKWRERSAVKITERTHEKDEETLLSRREGSHSEATFAGPGADLEAVR